MTRAAGKAPHSPAAQPVPELEGGTFPVYGPRHHHREGLILRRLRQHGPRAPALILDIGSGEGTLARRLAAAGYRVAAADRSEIWLRRVARAGGAAACLCDAQSLPFAEGALDAVTLGEVLEHLPRDVDALKEVRRVLRPGGVVVASVPANPALWDANDDAAGHLRRYTKDALARAATDAGLRVETVHHWGFPLARLFHRQVYLRALRAAKKRPVTPGGRLSRIAKRVGPAASWLFAVDDLFNGLPLGIGLILVARRPE